MVFADAGAPPSALCDGAPFDPSDARGYAASFVVGSGR
jgi:NitT/TauT family transport system ATP-binding protein/nitrate/nitrite transport system substrate-binding protein